MAKTANLKNRNYAKTFIEAKQIFKAKTGIEYVVGHQQTTRLYRFFKRNQTPTRKFFVGTEMEYIHR